jgi:hypothetical protein
LEQFGTEPFPIAIPQVPVAPADAASYHPNERVSFVNFRNLHLPDLNTPANAIKLGSTHRLHRPFCRCSEHLDCYLNDCRLVLAFPDEV